MTEKQQVKNKRKKNNVERSREVRSAANRILFAYIPDDGDEYEGGFFYESQRFTSYACDVLFLQFFDVY